MTDFEKWCEERAKAVWERWTQDQVDCGDEMISDIEQALREAAEMAPRERLYKSRNGLMVDGYDYEIGYADAREEFKLRVLDEAGRR